MTTLRIHRHLHPVLKQPGGLLHPDNHRDSETETHDGSMGGEPPLLHDHGRCSFKGVHHIFIGGTGDENSSVSHFGANFFGGSAHHHFSGKHFFSDSLPLRQYITDHMHLH